MNTSLIDNATLLEMCPQYSDLENLVIKETGFWIDGVAKTIVAIFGVLSNLSAFYVLRLPKMRNAFNKCLMALACIDTIFLSISIIEAFRRR